VAQVTQVATVAQVTQVATVAQVAQVATVAKVATAVQSLHSIQYRVIQVWSSVIQLGTTL